MSFSALDSALTGPLFASDAMRAVFDDRARIADMLAVEAALARAQAGLGLAPAGLAEAIAAVSPDAFDLAALGRETAQAGVPSIPFLAALRAMLPAEVAGDLHKGATTQDLLDGAQALALSRAFALVADDCDAILSGLARLAERHARTPCAGRTYGQHATPVSFGFKAAVWAAGIADVAAELPAVRDGACVASLAGPAGTLPAFGARAPEVADAFAREIGLPAALIAGHTRRAGPARAGTWLAMLLGALAKTAGDIAHLASTEVGEVAEPHAPGRGGSSAMPHKRNPVSCTVILAAASAARGHATTLLESMVAAHERPAGAWHAEWHALPALFGLASGALREARALAEGLVVDEAAMARNLDLTKGLLFADAAAAALAPVIGVEAAKSRVTAAADAVRARGIALRAALADGGDLPGDALDRAFDLAPYVDAAAAFVPRALARVATVRGSLRAQALSQPSLVALAARTGAIYERNAARFDADRSKGLHERVWLDRFLALVRPGGPVLDLGCGTGDPIAAQIAGTGRAVTGVDIAEAMLAIARSHHPDGDWRRGDMRALALPERFAGILAWNSFFHLTDAEQRATLPRIADHLEPGGALMLTVGPSEGTAIGRVGDEELFHASLSPQEYRTILAAHGVEVVAFVPEDPACAGQSVLLGRKSVGTA